MAGEAAKDGRNRLRDRLVGFSSDGVHVPVVQASPQDDEDSECESSEDENVDQLLKSDDDGALDGRGAGARTKK